MKIEIKRYKFLCLFNNFLLEQKLFGTINRSSRPEVKKLFLEISQSSQENACARVSFLIKLMASGLQLYSKRDSGKGVFQLMLRNF